MPAGAVALRDPTAGAVSVGVAHLEAASLGEPLALRIQAVFGGARDVQADRGEPCSQAKPRSSPRQKATTAPGSV